MKTVLVLIDGILFRLPLVENLGYQGGYHARAVKKDGKEIIVVSNTASGPFKPHKPIVIPTLSRERYWS